MNSTTNADTTNDIRVRLQQSLFNGALSLLIISLFPLALTSFIWLEVWNGVASRAIDGSGHYAIGQIYDGTIFPDTFGWTNAYFAGMSFPNFYPPLFHWLVALIHHTHLVSFAASFKLVMALPLLLIPAAFWFFVWVHGGRDYAKAYSVAIASMVLLTLGEVFQPNTGLDMSSTIVDGFYTQPLGFLLLLIWLLVYLVPKQRWWHFTLSALILALTVLANFFNAITALVVIASVLLFDGVSWFRAHDQDNRNILKGTLLSHFFSPAVALLLTAFWIVPMVTSYQYLVTRPIADSLIGLARPALWVWYLLAIVGFVIWSKRPEGNLWPSMVTGLVLFVLLVFSSVVAPPWFPLQVFRFFSTVNLLFAVPVGIGAWRIAQWYIGLKPKSVVSLAASKSTTLTRPIVLGSLVLIGLGGLAWVMSTKKLVRAFAFYTPENFNRISGVLEFGKTHRQGRYLVEVLPSGGGSLVRADSLALNAYLGAQGNETVSIVYREASPNSPFFNAELNAFSSYRENFGISSALMDDLDFLDQPIIQHLQRLNFIGVKYLVIASRDIKARLRKEPDITASQDIGGWTVFELQREPQTLVRSLRYRPALVVSKFTEKLRRQNDLDFARLAEEQFNDAWFDVLLVHSAGSKLDHLTNLSQFGGLILDQYDCDNETAAYNQLKAFAEMRPLILLTSEQSLFQRIKASIAEFPNAVVLERPTGDSPQWIDALQPTHRYNVSRIRQLWKSVRQILESKKTEVQETQVTGVFAGNKVEIGVGQATSTVPVLISTSFHPKWVRNDQKALYAVTPFFTLGFFDQNGTLEFRRSWYDRWALWCSGITLVSLVIFSTFAKIRNLRTLSGSRYLGDRETV